MRILLARFVRLLPVVFVAGMLSPTGGAAEPAASGPTGPGATAFSPALLAGIPADRLAVRHPQFRFTGLDPSEAETLLAEASAALYLPDWGEVWLLATPAGRGTSAGWVQLEGAPRPAFPPWEIAENRGSVTLAEFLAGLEARYPGLAGGAQGHYLLKLPAVRRGAIRTAAGQAAPPVGARSVVLSEGFEGDIWARWQPQDNTNGQNRWDVTTCDARSGTHSADAVRGGTLGATLPCLSPYPLNLETRLVDGACENFQGAAQAWLELYANLNSESGYDPLGVYYGGDDGYLYGYAFSGNFGGWKRLLFNLRQWYALGDLAANACNQLTLIFQSDNVGAPGWGARVDDITILAGEAPTLSCSATATPASGASPLTVQFTGSYSGGIGPTFSWYFDDGSSSASTQNASHTYAATGEYDPCFRVSSGNDRCYACTHVTVGSAPPFSVTVGANPTAGPAPLTVHFAATPSGGTAPYTYFWSFGDASPTSNEQNPTHTFGAAGTYNVTLSVHDFANTWAAGGVTVTVTQPTTPLTASATADTTTGVAPLSVHFFGSAGGGTPPYAYSWSFGDGSLASSDQNPAHIYAAAGNYTATLTVTDTAAGVATASVGVAATATSTHRYLVPAVAHNPGFGGTLWRTDIAAVGAADADAEISLTFRSGATTSTASATLAAGATVEWPNVLETLFGVPADANRSGSVEIVSTAPLSITSRTFNQSDAGTYGQYLPALTTADALGPGQVGVLPQLKRTADFRTNIGAINCGTVAATVNVRLFDGTGVQAGSTRTISVQPGEWKQENDIFVLAGAGERSVAYATVEVPNQNSRAWVYASVVDALTGDPTTVPVIAAGSGGLSASWRLAGPPGDSAEAEQEVGPDILQTWRPGISPAVARPRDASQAAMANAYAGYWYGKTDDDYPVNIHVTDGGQVDYLTLRVRMNFVTFTCTGDMSPSGPFALTGSTLDTTVSFPLSSITAHVTGTFTSSSVSGSYTGYSGSFYILCGSYLSMGTGSPLGNGTWNASRETATIPTATSTADVTSGASPLTVHFTGTASGGTPPYTYAWIFGDGYSSSSQNPTHTYKKAGTHQAIFGAWDSHHWLVQATPIAITVTAPPFSASASGSPTSGPAPLAVSFTGTPSGGVAPYTYSWDFGDGSTKSTSQNPTHTYSAQGDFTATLTAKDDASQSATATVAVHVTPPPPIAVTASADVTSGQVPLTVHFTGTASGGAAPYTYSWDFGDGSAASTSQNPTHTYASVGTFTATLTARDAGSLSASATVTITVSPAPPITADAGADVTTGQAPLSVHFTGAASGGTPPYTYAWSFGDGSPASSSQSPTHTYQGAGAYTATLTVTDSASVSGSDTVAVTVTAPPASVAYLVPAVAHNPGSGGTVWRTDIGAVNPGSAWASFTLRFIGSSTRPAAVMSLAPGAATEWVNVLETVFGVAPSENASGAVEIASDRPLVLAARTYNATPAGTYGQYLPALRHVDTLTSGQVGVLPQLKKTAAFRTNVGAVNHGDAPATVAIRLFDSSGSQVGSTRTITVQPSAWLQHNDIFTLTTAGEQTIAYATVEVTTGGALMWVYASVVDEQTGDPTTVPVLRR